MYPRYSVATGMAAASMPMRRYPASPNRIMSAIVKRPPPTATHRAWRTTAPPPASRPAPCIWEIMGVTAIATPDRRTTGGK